MDELTHFTEKTGISRSTKGLRQNQSSAAAFLIINILLLIL